MIDVAPKAIDVTRLDASQADASQGLYAQAMSGFIQWLAPQYEDVRQRLPLQVAELRENAKGSAEHTRTPDIVANLALGLRLFLTYAREIGAIS